MALVKISKGADIRHEYTDGVSRVPVLEGAYKDAAVERISLQPGAELSPALYSKTEHNQVFLITAGKGLSLIHILASRKAGWIDYDAGGLAQGDAWEPHIQALLQLVLDTACLLYTSRCV